MHTEESKKKIGDYWRGRKRSDETKLKMSVTKIGNQNGKIRKNLSNSYRAIHHWANNNIGKPDTCIKCGTSGLSGHKIHWANISSEYKRDISDWMRLCTSCHGKYDSEKRKLI